MFSNLFLKLATWALSQALGSKKGSAAVAQAAPILATVADAAGRAAEIRIDHAAGTGGDVQKVVDLVRTAQGLGL